MNFTHTVMHTTPQLILAACILQGTLALAAASGDASSDRRSGPSPINAAFEACKSKGRPGESAFDECMTSKGFTKPEGGQKPPAR